jgi:POT family proton-dependent oligopeptide transporter
MTNATNLDIDAVAQAGLADPEYKGVYHNPAKGTMDVTGDEKSPSIVDASVADSDEEWPDKPTDEELHTLRRVSGPILWSMWTIAFCELCERFSYYGSSVLYTNYVNNPLPAGSTNGSPRGSTDPNAHPGALGFGPKAAQGISLTNQFFTYLTPLLGAYLADARWGRFWTLHLAIGIATIAHVILVVSSIPQVITNPDASFGIFIVGMLCLCVGSGFFKANVSPLLAEQNQDTRMRVETRKGERVIVDPAITNTRVFLYFYFCINIGALSGQIGMVYVELDYGFWPAFVIPTGLFLLAPLVLWSNKKKYKLSPPTGSLFSKFLKLFMFVRKRSNGRKMNWEVGKPSSYTIDERPGWMTYDDAWVDEVRRGLMACKVFLFLPVFWLAYNQMTGNLTIQASTLVLNGVPNDVIQNLNPISIVIMIPILDHVVYPGLRKMGIAFTPIKRMTIGFFFSCASMIAAAVMQHYIYTMSPCGEYANGQIYDEELGEKITCPPANINVWAQSLPYILVGLSEIFTNVTSYEYAYSKAPENMKSLVMSINLFMSAISAAIGQAFTPLSGDPLLVWNYTVVACIAFVAGVAFWFCFRHLDSDEDKWNMLKKTKFIGNNQPTSTTDTKAVDGGERA